jgi:hypothetical protein
VQVVTRCIARHIDFTICPPDTFVGITTRIVDYHLDGPQHPRVLYADGEEAGAGAAG